MKKFFSVLSIILLLLAITACSETYDITFVAGDETLTIPAVEGGNIEAPEDPTRENYIFDGWFYDKECTKPLGAYDTAISDITLYAGWRFDYADAINRIFDSSVKMNVSVYTASYNTSFGRVTEEVSANGSGVIFKETGSYYYLITNNHVVEKEAGYSKVRYTVTDCYETPYDEVTLISASAEYDLAVLRFKRGEQMLEVAEFAEAEAQPSDIVISISQPEGLKNAVTFGKLEKTESVTLNEGSEKSEVTFPVIHHTAPVNHGSSGGVLLNEKLEVIGINYAVATDTESGEFLYGFAIPLDKVLEFIDTID